MDFTDFITSDLGSLLAEDAITGLIVLAFFLFRRAAMGRRH